MNLLLSLCDKSYIVQVMLIVKTVFKLLCYLAPLIIIIISSIHIFKVVLNGKEDDLKDALKVTVKRIIAGLIIFFLPAMINYVFTSLVKGNEVDFIACFESASKEKVEKLKAKEQAEEEAEKKAQEKEDEKLLREVYEKEQKQKGTKKQSFEEWKQERETQNQQQNNSTVPSGNGSFNLDHAINVTSDPHSDAHEDLPWHGGTVGSHAGMIGAYVEAINILNGTDYTLKEVYDKIISSHPNQKAENEPVYENTDINDYYNISVTRAPANMTEIKNAISQGKLVAEIVDTDKWLDENGNFFGKDGRHTGLIFYFDGTHYHMKTSVKKNAIYTEEQLKEWLGDTKTELIIYSKK